MAKDKDQDKAAEGGTDETPADQPAPAEEAGDLPDIDAEASRKGYFGKTPDDTDYSIGKGGRGKGGRGK